MLRRSMLSTTAMLPVATALAACGLQTPSAPGTIPGQVIADVTGALNVLAADLPALTATTPPVLTSAQEAPLLVDVRLALGFLATISGGTPAQTGVTALARAEAYFNAVLTALMTAPLPPPYNLAVIAANVVAASLEAYINSVVPPAPVPAPVPTPAASRAKAVAPGMTIEKARAVLHINPAE